MSDRHQDSDRRASRRTGLVSQVEIDVPSDSPGPDAPDSTSGETVDVGPGGLLARVQAELAAGTPCVVRLMDPQSGTGAVEARGFVRRSRVSADGVLMGIEFEAPINAVRQPGQEGRLEAIRLDAMKVLVVDDEPAIVELLYRFLSRRGCVVSTAGSGEKALAALRAAPHDVTLLDLMMPGINGLQILRSIRDEGLEAGRIWAMSGYASNDDARQALRLGASDFINKPLDLKYLEWSMQLHRAAS